MCKFLEEFSISSSSIVSLVSSVLGSRSVFGTPCTTKPCLRLYSVKPSKASSQFIVFNLCASSSGVLHCSL